MDIKAKLADPARRAAAIAELSLDECAQVASEMPTLPPHEWRQVESRARRVLRETRQAALEGGAPAPAQDDAESGPEAL